MTREKCGRLQEEKEEALKSLDKVKMAVQRWTTLDLIKATKQPVFTKKKKMIVEKNDDGTETSREISDSNAFTI